MNENETILYNLSHIKDMTQPAIIRCKICNRKLKGTKARKNGYGTHCYKLYLNGFRGFQSSIDDFIKDKHD